MADFLDEENMDDIAEEGQTEAVEFIDLEISNYPKPISKSQVLHMKRKKPSLMQ